MEYFLIYLAIGIVMMLAFANRDDSVNPVLWLLLFPLMILIKIVERAL